MVEKLKILVVDDDVQLLDAIKATLNSTDDYAVTTATDAETALHHMQETVFATIVTDFCLPKIDGLTLLERIKAIDAEIPVILMTGFADFPMLQAALRLGASDFLSKPFDMQDLLNSVNRTVAKHKAVMQNDNYTKSLEALVRQQTKELFQANHLWELHFVSTSLALINALEANHEYSKGHSERVTNISMLIGKRLELSVQELKILRTGAVLHDIGKIGLFHTLLNKTGSLSSLEADLIKQHPLVGHNIISPVALDKEICNIILQHHERVDGTGYPHGLVDHEISFLAKIVAIADSYDAMTSGRAYRENLSHVQAYQEIKRCAGSRYDLICTDCFINLAEILDFTTLDFMSADQFLSIDM